MTATKQTIGIKTYIYDAELLAACKKDFTSKESNLDTVLGVVVIGDKVSSILRLAHDFSGTEFGACKVDDKMMEAPNNVTMTSDPSNAPTSVTSFLRRHTWAQKDSAIDEPSRRTVAFDEDRNEQQTLKSGRSIRQIREYIATHGRPSNAAEQAWFGAYEALRSMPESVVGELEKMRDAQREQGI